MFDLHATSVMIVTGVIIIIIGIVFFYSSRCSSVRFHLTLSFVLFGIASIAIGFKKSLHPVLSMVISNIILSISVVLIHRGTQILINRRRQDFIYILSIITIGITYYYCVIVFDNPSVRIFTISFFRVPYFVDAALSLRHSPLYRDKNSINTLVRTLLFGSFWYLLRACLAISSNDMAVILRIGPMQSINFVIGAVINLLILIYLLLIEADAKVTAEKANDAKTRFLASVSHDLRQPIQAVRFFLFLIKLKSNDEDVEKIILQMEDTLHSTELMLSRLMDFATLESGKISIKYDAFPIRALIEDLIDENEDNAVAKGISIRYYSPKYWTESDPVLLGLIVRNLISNAIRYTDRGGILIGVRRRGDNLRIEVWDTGKGIPTDKQQEIFEEFKRLENFGRNQDGGHGLGLAIVAKIAELLGHRLFLSSAVGRGSVFAIEVPRVDCPGGVAEVESAPSVPIVGSATILVIENDLNQAGALYTILTAYGFHVVIAHDADEAIAVLPIYLDLIISDYRLPGSVTGVGIVTSIRQALGRSIPAIIVTGDTQSTVALEVARAGCKVAHKPYTPKVLLGMICRLLPPPPPQFSRVIPDDLRYQPC